MLFSGTNRFNVLNFSRISQIGFLKFLGPDSRVLNLRRIPDGNICQ